MFPSTTFSSPSTNSSNNSKRNQVDFSKLPSSDPSSSHSVDYNLMQQQQMLQQQQQMQQYMQQMNLQQQQQQQQSYPGNITPPPTPIAVARSRGNPQNFSASMIEIPENNNTNRFTSQNSSSLPVSTSSSTSVMSPVSSSTSSSTSNSVSHTKEKDDVKESIISLLAQISRLEKKIEDLSQPSVCKIPRPEKTNLSVSNENLDFSATLFNPSNPEFLIGKITLKKNESGNISISDSLPTVTSNIFQNENGTIQFFSLGNVLNFTLSLNENHSRSAAPLSFDFFIHF